MFCFFRTGHGVPPQALIKPITGESEAGRWVNLEFEASLVYTLSPETASYIKPCLKSKRKGKGEKKERNPTRYFN